MALWLRYRLNEITESKTSLKILKQTKSYRTEIKPFKYTEEKENLFQKYRNALNFNISDSLFNILFDGAQHNIFNTYEVCIYDGEELIGLGIFDIGSTSAQGLINIYDPKFKKKSIGKALILNKIKYAQSQNIEYFYPGYFAPGYGAFDYKVELYKKGIYYYEIRDKSWYNLELLDQNQTILNYIYNALSELVSKPRFKENQLFLMFYKFFDVKLYKEYASYELLGIPYFIKLGEAKDGDEYLIVFNARKLVYQIIIAKQTYDVFMPSHRLVYSSHFLKASDTIYETASTKDLETYLFDYFKKYINDFGPELYQ
jgi:leucyl-tRNA---protein transferase